LIYFLWVRRDSRLKLPLEIKDVIDLFMEAFTLGRFEGIGL
jgi:hypothetical protein